MSAIRVSLILAGLASSSCAPTTPHAHSAADYNEYAGEADSVLRLTRRFQGSATELSALATVMSSRQDSTHTQRLTELINLLLNVTEIMNRCRSVATNFIGTRTRAPKGFQVPGGYDLDTDPLPGGLRIKLRLQIGSTLTRTELDHAKGR
jgi:hypothetical protein